MIIKKRLNAPDVVVAGELADVPDFAFAFVRFALGADVDSSSGGCLLEDEVVAEEDLMEVESERVCVVSGTTNC